MIILFSLFLLSNVSYGTVSSWLVGQEPSLILADAHNMVCRDQSYMVNMSNLEAFIRVQDIEVQPNEDFTQIFVLFEKIHFASYVDVQFIDSFTDEVLFSHRFYESGNVNLEEAGKRVNLIHLKIIVHGDDIKLRGAGVDYIKKVITRPELMVLNQNRLQKNTDDLKIDITLQEEAKLYVYIYNNQQNIEKRIVSGAVLAEGTYSMQWDPSKIVSESGAPYYVWVKAENLRSAPVEFVKEFYIIP